MKSYVSVKMGTALLVALGFVGTFSRPKTACGQAINPGSITAKLVSIGPVGTSSYFPITDLAGPASDSSNGNRLFTAELTGGIRLIKNGSLVAAPFADLNEALKANLELMLSGGENGLLGLEFHPGFNAENSAGYGKFYTYSSEYISLGEQAPTFGHPEFEPVGTGRILYKNVLREWTTSPSSDTLTNANSRVLFSIAKQNPNHNGGGLKFGPNNYLYLGIGDGGGEYDEGSASDTANGHTNGTGNGQDISNIYGKIIRIDPLAPALTPTSSDPISANGAYRIPASNPFVGSTPGMDEVFLYGLRNPWRFSFDRAHPNDLYIGDVGQLDREEVDWAHVSDITGSNNNYGWPFLEGTMDDRYYDQSGAGSVLPIAEYSHLNHNASVQGGFVYRGTLMPALFGKYVFGDLGEGIFPGKLFYMDPAGGPIYSLLIDPSGLSPTSLLCSFGEDQSGELYTLWSNGSIIKLVPEPATMGLVGLLAFASLYARPHSSRR